MTDTTKANVWDFSPLNNKHILVTWRFKNGKKS